MLIAKLMLVCATLGDVFLFSVFLVDTMLKKITVKELFLFMIVQQVVNLCWSHGLYDAIIYVYNKGMHDYTTPLEELLGILQQAVRTGIQLTDEQIRLGNKLLVYIR